VQPFFDSIGHLSWKDLRVQKESNGGSFSIPAFPPPPPEDAYPFPRRKSLLTAPRSYAILVKTAISNQRSAVSEEMGKNHDRVFADS